MSFLKGFKYAFCGIIHCVKNERNMRFHTVAALYVLIFARFFHFTKGEWGLLILTIGSVIAAEAVNTAIEALCDKVCEQKDNRIKITKDAAAGAVLALAIAAAAIGAVLFSSAEGWQELAGFYYTHPVNLIGLLILSVLSVLFVVLTPKKSCQREKKEERNRRKNNGSNRKERSK